MTFITPLAIAHATHNQASDYTEHAANQHFVLQESVRMSGAGSHGAGGVLEKGGAVAAAVVGQALSSLGRMLVGSTGSGTTAGDPRPQSGGIATGMILDTPPQTPQLSRKRTVADYRYRIILKLLATGDAQGGGSGSIYVVAVSDTLKDIHTDWHWIEQHLFRELAKFHEQAASDSDTDEDARVDDFLMGEFEALTRHLDFSPGLPGRVEAVQDMNTHIRAIFRLEGEALVSFHKGGYWAAPNVYKRGYLSLTRNYVLFHAESAATDEADRRYNVAVPLKDVVGIEVVPPRRIFASECVKVTTKEKEYLFGVNTNAQRVVQQLNHLTNVAMELIVRVNNETELIRGGTTSGAEMADNRVSDTATPRRTTFNNLASEEVRRPLALSTFGEQSDSAASSPTFATSRISFVGSRPRTLSAARRLGAPLGPGDSSLSIPPGRRGSLSLGRRPPSTTGALQESTASTLASSPVEADLVETVERLDENTRNNYFRSLLRLPLSETQQEVQTCTFWNKTTNTSHHGRLLISQRFISFLSTDARSPVAATVMVPGTAGLGALGSFDIDVVLVIPLDEITIIKREQGSLFASLFSAGSLVIAVRSKREFWFSGFENREGTYDRLMELLRTVDFPASHEVPLRHDPGHHDMALGNDEDVAVAPEPLTTPLRLLFTADSHVNRISLENQREAPWVDYFATHGRDCCMVKDTVLRELVVGGVPDAFRCDLWMVLSGAAFEPLEHNYYRSLLEEASARKKEVSSGAPRWMAADEIEKDLHRSLPEHPAYQSPIGIDALRRVLTAFAVRNPLIGYAQAMNILTSVFLLFLKEEDAFSVLCAVCERLLPENYSKTLVGTVIDQACFESLVEEHLPALWAKFREVGVELSMFSVPWFVCLFINTLPFRIACRALDCFFYDGPTFLFKLSLSILRINQDRLVSSHGEENILPCLRDYFLQLDLGTEATAYAAADGSSLSGTALCDELFTTAFTVYRTVTPDKIETLRVRNRRVVVQRMEATNRKSQIATLAETSPLSARELGVIYDEFKKSQFLERHGETIPWSSSLASVQAGSIATGSMSALNSTPGGAIGLRMFNRLMREISPWRGASVVTTRANTRTKKHRIDVDLLLETMGDDVQSWRADWMEMGLAGASLNDHIFRYTEAMDTPASSMPLGVGLPSIVRVMDVLCGTNSNARIRFFHTVHDVDGDGALNWLEFLHLIDSFMWLFCGGLAVEVDLQAVVATSVAAVASPPMIMDHGVEMAVIAGREDGVAQEAPKQLVPAATPVSPLSKSDDERETKFLTALQSFVVRVRECTVKDVGGSDGNTSSDFNGDAAPRPVPHPVYALPPLYSELGARLRTCVLDHRFRLVANDFLIAVLAEPVLMEFFERRGEL